LWQTLYIEGGKTTFRARCTSSNVCLVNYDSTELKEHARSLATCWVTFHHILHKQKLWTW